MVQRLWQDLGVGFITSDRIKNMSYHRWLEHLGTCEAKHVALASRLEAEQKAQLAAAKRT